ncbi:phosphatidylinositol 3 [Loa loa]|uniref:Phosphatidylinositol 4-kinase type 2 n=1 Tax=Loa loa TaxID=7209 RepID=A0A1I7VH89_LOALO|nr:phosphatidylinositol 3 [Loa loa]EFO18641.2 phosphatidylinositol 3 [Loa loa]
MKRRQQIKMFWRRLHGEDNKLKILMLDVDDEDFVENLNDCLEAFQSNIHPILIPSGSSGSYFVRNLQGRHIGVFKPKDEEPFAENNPKWPKFLQRFLCFCCYGRSCLIPLNGYLSEVAASLVDERLQLFIVPKTRIVKMTSPAFFYPRRCCTASDVYPKIGSYQLFVHGYKPAYDVVPGWELISGTNDPLTSIERKRFLVLFQKMCVLDYVIRNTDRTMDNWLIRYIPDEILDIAAIDHGLAFPVKHPETATVLRPFVYGWANMESTREPWDEQLRDRLLSLLTPMFVHRLCVEIRKLFMIDTTNNRFLINNQLKVFRGQLWNLRLALLENESPLKMIQRPLVIVAKRYRKYPTSDIWEECFKAKTPDYSGRRCC